MDHLLSHNRAAVQDSFYLRRQHHSHGNWWIRSSLASSSRCVSSCLIVLPLSSSWRTSKAFPGHSPVPTAGSRFAGLTIGSQFTSPPKNSSQSLLRQQSGAPTGAVEGSVFDATIWLWLCFSSDIHHRINYSCICFTALFFMLPISYSSIRQLTCQVYRIQQLMHCCATTCYSLPLLSHRASRYASPQQCWTC